MNEIIITLEKAILIWQFIAIVSIALIVLLAIANIKLKSSLNIYLQETTDLIRTSNKYNGELVQLRKLYKEKTEELNSLKNEVNG